jgi:hypothetical protein
MGPGLQAKQYAPDRPCARPHPDKAPFGGCCKCLWPGEVHLAGRVRLALANTEMHTPLLRWAILKCSG